MASQKNAHESDSFSFPQKEEEGVNNAEAIEMKEN